MAHAHPTLLVQPDDGAQPVADFINTASESLLIKQFSFTHPLLIAAVIERQRSGVDVRVMLNPQRSSGSRANDDTFEKLKAEGVNIQWASPLFAVTHEKSIVVDKKAALIATFNLCEKYFTQTRDYGFITRNPIKVDQIVTCFEADWAHEKWVPDDSTDLVWSNSNSRRIMANFIDATESTLEVQHPKFVDAVILERLLAAAARGVHVRILCGGRHGISEYDVLDTFSSLRILKTGDIKVHKQKNLRLHAKLILADGKKAFLGSMNIDRSAFDLRRELGVVITKPDIVAGLSKVFESDWESSHHYDAPDPLVPKEEHPPENEFPHDPELVHE